MRLSTDMLLPALVGLLPALSSLVYASPDYAKVYIFGDLVERTTSSHYPTLSSETAGLVIAQRLGVSSYHSLKHADEPALENINKFGGRQQKLFADADNDEPSQLVLMVEGITKEMGDDIEQKLGMITPDFVISNPPSAEANQQFAQDITTQFKAVDSLRKGGIVSLNHSEDVSSYVDVMRMYLEDYSTVVLMLFPKSSSKAAKSPKPYGTYEIPSSNPQVSRREEETEEPMVEAVSSFVVPGAEYSPSESGPTKLPKVVPLCFSSMDTCVSSTNNCSGHGACYQKHAGSDGGAGKPCFACGCVATFETNNGTNITTHWGGGACSKIDISSPFWLISGFTVLLVFLVSWAIGMLFSIGEEKLPGVIGAGVSGAKAR